MANSLPAGDLERIRNALVAGRKIEAIKLYRECTGAGLREAKNYVETLEEELRRNEPWQFPPTPQKSGCGLLVLLLIFAAQCVMR